MEKANVVLGHALSLADNASIHFKDKTEVLCQNRSPLPADDTPTVVGAHFDVYEHASPSDVKKNSTGICHKIV